MAEEERLKLKAAERKQRKLDEAQDLTAKEEAQRKAKADTEENLTAA
jgi:hypothetical protein